MPRERKAKRKRRQKAARAAGRPPKGLAAFYAAKAADRAAARKERAIQTLAKHGNGWAFGARCESQFLVLAQALAEILALRDEREADPELARERAEVQAASDYQKTLLDHKRVLRSAGIYARFDDPAERGESGPIGPICPWQPRSTAPTAKVGTYTAETRHGTWERCPAEQGRFDLMNTGLPWWQHVSIGHAPGDMKAKHEERVREVRFYDFDGPEIDPEGSHYWRLAGHIPANLPLPALKRCVDELIKAWGDNPADWRETRQEPLRDAAGKLIFDGFGHVALSRDIIRDEQGEPVRFPLFPELAEKLKNNKNIAPDASGTGRPLAADGGKNEQNTGPRTR